VWATAEDVLAATGVDVTLTPVWLTQANGIINMHAGIADDATVYVRDEYWLQQAVIWQTAWLAGQPGVMERSSVTTVSQEGMQVTYQDEAALTLAPLARRCLKNLSWMGSRSVRLARRVNVRKTTDVDPPDECWTPMAGA
jgi:hypothetical protein